MDPLGQMTTAEFYHSKNNRGIDHRPQPVGLWAMLLLSIAICALAACQKSALSERDRIIEESRQAARVDDYARAYELLLPLAQAGDTDAQFSLSALIPPDAGLLPKQDMIRTSELIELVWLRKAAYGGSEAAITMLANDYATGSNDLPKDQRVSECYRKVAAHVVRITECQRQEQIKGYITTAHPVSACTACEPAPPN